MNILSEFGLDPETFALGNLCKRGHDFEGTGGSLRYKHSTGKTAGCVECSKIKADRRKSLKPEPTSKFVLGSLCKRGHEHEKTGKSLRYARGTNICVACNKELSEEYRRENHGALNEYHKKYYQENKDAFLDNRKKYLERPGTKEKIQEYRKRPDVAQKHRERAKLSAQLNKVSRRIKNKEWREENKEYISQKHKEYRATDKGREACKQGKRSYYARKAKVHALPIAPESLLARLEEFQQRCAYCHDQFQSWDHFIPVSKGGSDTIGNLVPCCKHCNSSKRSQDPLEWYSSQPFYSEKQWKNILKILGKNPKTYNQIPLL